jgi:putative sterol carrier protein
MALSDATEAVRALFAKTAGFSDKVVFDFGPDGRIAVDGGAKPIKVSNGALEADCTISMTLADFERMLKHELDPQMAFMTGKLTVKGNLGVAMNLVGLLKA